MSFEKLVIFGVLIFGFMAVTQLLRTVHDAKKMSRRAGKKRARRLISAEPVAMQVATSLVTEVAAKHAALSEQAERSGILPKKLEHALAEAREHYMERVNPKFKGLFYTAINIVILKKEK